MSYKILTPIMHGAGGQVFSLQPGEIVKHDFFPSKQAEQLKEIGAIKFLVALRNQDLKSDFETTEIPTLRDIKSMTVAEAKEFLNTETSVTNLHKFLDAEMAGGHARKGVIDFTNMRIKELTGYDA